MGQGDTDGVDSNGNIYINGGTVDITGNSPFDYDGEGKLNGGTLTVNGTQTTTLTNQMMGGGMKGGKNREMQQNGNMPEQMEPNGDMQMNGGQQIDPNERMQNGEGMQGKRRR